MKKRLILLSLCIGLLTLAITGGAIFANGGGRSLAHSRGNITERVAELLGLETVEVQLAFDQAVREQQNAKMATRLDRIVENDVVTREEADDILAWYESRPNIRMVNRILFASGNEAELQQKLDRMVENEHLSQAEADQIMAWFETRPAVVDTIERPERRGSHNRWGKGQHRRGGDAQFNRRPFSTHNGSFQVPSESFQAPRLEQSLLY